MICVVVQFDREEPVSDEDRDWLKDDLRLLGWQVADIKVAKKIFP